MKTKVINVAVALTVKENTNCEDLVACVDCEFTDFEDRIIKHDIFGYTVPPSLKLERIGNEN